MFVCMSDLSCKLKMGAASRFLSVFAVTLDGQTSFSLLCISINSSQLLLLSMLIKSNNGEKYGGVDNGDCGVTGVVVLVVAVSLLVIQQMLLNAAMVHTSISTQCNCLPHKISYVSKISHYDISCSIF